jgi:hypothetical protein
VKNLAIAEKKYNNEEYLLIRKNRLEYTCLACNKVLKYKGSKPNSHLSTKLHAKNFSNWINSNKLIRA